jgi:hypothetical protein
MQTSFRQHRFKIHRQDGREREIRFGVTGSANRAAVRTHVDSAQKRRQRRRVIYVDVCRPTQRHHRDKSLHRSTFVLCSGRLAVRRREVQALIIGPHAAVTDSGDIHRYRSTRSGFSPIPIVPGSSASRPTNFAGSRVFACNASIGESPASTGRTNSSCRLKSGTFERAIMSTHFGDPWELHVQQSLRTDVETPNMV